VLSKTSAQKRIHERLCRFVRTRYELIKPKGVRGVFNFRCFENAVQYAHDHPGHEVIEVIYIDGGDPILHYVNFLPESGEYVETTLGWRAEHLEYYRVRRIHPDDWKHIHAEFDRALTSWTEEWATWWERKVLGIARVV
jgi:hypothetical protein